MQEYYNYCMYGFAKDVSCKKYIIAAITINLHFVKSTQSLTFYYN